MRERLSQLIFNKLSETCRECSSLECTEKLTDFLLANGVIVPPCKSGDVLWYLDYALPKCFMSPEKIFVQDVLLINGTMAIRCSTLSYNLRIEDFGKTVFLTREEAEAALVNYESSTIENGGAE